MQGQANHFVRYAPEDIPMANPATSPKQSVSTKSSICVSKITTGWWGRSTVSPISTPTLATVLQVGRLKDEDVPKSVKGLYR